jgi:hypothetical protein
MLYVVIFFVFISTCIVLFVLRIKAVIEYIRNEQEEWVKFSFYTGKGLFRYERKVPLVQKEDRKDKFKLVKGQGKGKEMKGGSEKNERLGPFDIIKKFNSVRIYLKDHKSILEGIRKYINKNNIRVELIIKVEQGTGDAAQTGIICGLLWSAAGIFNAYISRHIKIVSHELNITPSFDKKIFGVDASCIFHVRLVHIIVVLIKIYYMKYRIRMKAKNAIGGEVSG